MDEPKVVESLFPRVDEHPGLVKLILVGHQRYVEVYVSEAMIEDEPIFGAYVHQSLLPRLRGEVKGDQA